MKYIYIIIIVIVVAVTAYLVAFRDTENMDPGENGDTNGSESTEEQTEEETSDPEDQATGSTEREPVERIARSVEGRDITAYHYGDGDREILFVAGLHGGYSWNTALLAYEMMDYFENNPDAIPSNVTVTVIPTLNPDGQHEVFNTAGRFSASDAPARRATVAGRFNANGVDLNRNFDCNWKEVGHWQDRTVDTGDEPFSEPESRALRDYVSERKPAAVVLYYSASGDVIASNCNDGISSETRQIMNKYADAANYPAKEEFDYYSISGDAGDWLAKVNIPSFSVVLSSHDSTEWTKNRRGVETLLNHYSN